MPVAASIVQCLIPATAAMEAKTLLCSAFMDHTAEDDALSQYNALREHSGLPKVRNLPKGTSFKAGPVAHPRQREMALK